MLLSTKFTLHIPWYLYEFYKDSLVDKNIEFIVYKKCSLKIFLMKYIFMYEIKYFLKDNESNVIYKDKAIKQICIYENFHNTCLIVNEKKYLFTLLIDLFKNMVPKQKLKNIYEQDNVYSRSLFITILNHITVFIDDNNNISNI